MAFKMGLNKQDQLKVKEGFEDGVEPKVMAKKLKTTVDVIMKFKPELQEEAAAYAKEADAKIKQEEAEAQQKAKVLNAALDEFK